MGSAGTDVALETADIALMADDLSKLATTIRLARKAERIIRVNIWFSLLTKAVFVVLAVLGMAALWMAVFADMGASLLVVLNGLRGFGFGSDGPRGPRAGRWRRVGLAHRSPIKSQIHALVPLALAGGDPGNQIQTRWPSWCSEGC